MKKESFRAFQIKAKEIEGVTEVGLKSHFKGSYVKGKRLLPHFVCDFTSEQMTERLGIEQDRVMIEKVGLTMARKHIEQIGESGLIKTSDAIALLNAVNRSADSRKLVKLKEREVEDKDNRFNKMLNAALYGGKVIPSDETHIRDAEIDDTPTIDGILESPAAEESPICDSAGA